MSGPSEFSQGFQTFKMDETGRIHEASDSEWFLHNSWISAGCIVADMQNQAPPNSENVWGPPSGNQTW